MFKKIYRKMACILRFGVVTDLKKFKAEGGTIGKNCEIYPQVEFGSEPYLISIGDHVRITQGVKFITHDGGVWVFRQNKEMMDIDVVGPIKVGNNVHIGWNAIIMPNVTIGDNCVIGAGAVVTRDIPANSVAAGVPAKVIKNLDEYKSKVLANCVHTKKMNKKDKEIYLRKHFGL